MQKKIDSGRGTSRPEGSKSSTRRRRRTSSGSCDSEESSRDTSSYSRKRKRRRYHRDRSQDEFKKAKPPTFDGEIKTRQEAEAWLLGTKKYFQVRDFRYFLFWDREVHQKYALWVLVGCRIKFRIQRVLSLEI